MCTECSIARTSEHCPSCRALIGGQFAFSRTDFDFNRLWENAFEIWKRELWMLVVCGLIVFGAGAIGGIIGLFFNFLGTGISMAAGEKSVVGILAVIAGQLISQAISMVLQGIGLMGFIRVCIDVLEGRKADPARMFTQLNKAGQYVIQLLVISFGIALPVLIYLGIVLLVSMLVGGLTLSGGGFREFANHPGPAIAIFGLGVLAMVPVLFYVTLPLSFASLELVYSGADAIESLRRAWSLAAGFRTQIFGYGFVGALVLMAGLLACCVGVLAAFPLQQLLIVSLFLALRNGSGLPAPAESQR